MGGFLPTELVSAGRHFERKGPSWSQSCTTLSAGPGEAGGIAQLCLGCRWNQRWNEMLPLTSGKLQTLEAPPDQNAWIQNLRTTLSQSVTLSLPTSKARSRVTD